MDEEQRVGEKRLDGLRMTTVVVAYDLGDPSPQRNAVECAYIRQKGQHLYLLQGRVFFVSNQVIYGFKHSG
jgi:hypothetical protein